MEKLVTIQKRNNLNSVYRMGEMGPGGAYHGYEICPAGQDPHFTDAPVFPVIFQKGPRNAQGSTSGVLDVDLLEIVRDRLTAFQNGDYRCRENAIALTHVEEALLWMNKRVEDRAERNVLGTTQK